MAKAYQVGAVVVVGALALAACGSSSSGSGDNGGGGAKTVIISSDLPLQGASKDASDSTNNAITLYLDQIGNKVGDYTIQFKPYDDSTAAAGQWDPAQCTKNANDHVNNPDEIAVMGTYNSGCAQIEVPILNQAPNGGMLMVSHANTNPGLTKPWDPGTPEKYYPSGKRTYARVVTTDDFQGAAAAQFMAKDLGVKRCAVVNDNQTYGQGVAKAFADEAAKQGITVTSNTPWDNKQPNYTSFFETIKSQNVDCLYIGGIYDNNGGQLLKDKVKVLGDNDAVKMMGPDGFTGYPALVAQPESQGMYLSFPGLSTDVLKAGGGGAAKLLSDYNAKYGKDPASSYALYGVAAVQVILKALENSDGTRAGLINAVFSGDGVTIPADESAIGKELHIDPQTGDVNAKDISIEIVKGNAETFFKAWPVA
jgi:branched-chain amino acid transport system substrate-binding protein